MFIEEGIGTIRVRVTFIGAVMGAVRVSGQDYDGPFIGTGVSVVNS